MNELDRIEELADDLLKGDYTKANGALFKQIGKKIKWLLSELEETRKERDEYLSTALDMRVSISELQIEIKKISLADSGDGPYGSR